MYSVLAGKYFCPPAFSHASTIPFSALIQHVNVILSSFFCAGEAAGFQSRRSDRQLALGRALPVTQACVGTAVGPLQPGQGLWAGGVLATRRLGLALALTRAGVFCRPALPASVPVWLPAPL